MIKKINNLVSSMTLEEKASLCSGKDFWFTKDIEHLGIPSMMMTDGPHGMRKQADESDHIGLNISIPATCFPSGAGLAASWNRELLESVGSAIAREALAEDVRIILGPGVNIKRSPLCGRNFEYFSEDPYLTGKLAIAHIMGHQNEGVGTSIKHYAVNNQEKRRMGIDVKVDERTLREIYFPAFEMAVKEAQPWSVMCAYNKLNGEYCAENKWLLTDILKEEWGHTGIVVTDWGANNNRVKGLKAGQELEMPGHTGTTDKEIADAVKNGELDEEVLDKAVRRILDVTFRSFDKARKNKKADLKKHHALARKIAGECIVLLKNENSLLPFSGGGVTAFIGAFAKEPRYQGGGSSHINTAFLDTAYESAVSSGKSKILFAPGYSLLNDNVDSKLIEEAVKTAEKADRVVLFLGLPKNYESEGFDRIHLKIPESHVVLLEEVVKANKNVAVVLSNGAPVEMPWIDNAKALLEGYLGGQASGSAIIDILWGDINPSGKLAETFPVRLEDNPSFINFPGDLTAVEYREGIFIGYRYYEKKNIIPLFPFGHGLSYTQFEYSKLKTESEWFPGSKPLTVKIDITNTGKLFGKEIVQLYVEDAVCSVIRPVKELKGFDKVSLKQGETKTVKFNLDDRSFAFWDDKTGSWRIEQGIFKIHIGASSADIRQSCEVMVAASHQLKTEYDRNSFILDLKLSPVGKKYYMTLTKKMISLFGEFQEDSAEKQMLSSLVAEMPLRNIVRLSGFKNYFSESDLNLFIDCLNGKIGENKLPESIRELSLI